MFAMTIRASGDSAFPNTSKAVSDDDAAFKAKSPAATVALAGGLSGLNLKW
jgi:hypothetical protein